MEKEAITILQFLALSERLKRELRHSCLSDGRRESVAEHTWQMALANRHRICVHGVPRDWLLGHGGSSFRRLIA
jgi:hypothetical protein